MEMLLKVGKVDFLHLKFTLFKVDLDPFINKKLCLIPKRVYLILVAAIKFNFLCNCDLFFLDFKKPCLLSIREVLIQG